MRAISADNAATSFHNGNNYRAHEYLGVHLENARYVFRVWAPGADNVFLMGDFNRWDSSMKMKRISEKGIYEFYDAAGRVHPGDNYKFKIVSGAKTVLKSDPYARHSEQPPGTASVVPTDESYKWRDECWLAYAQSSKEKFCRLPMNVYELHLASWRRRDNGKLPNYREIAPELATYVKQMGYTHIEIMPIMEHPYGPSLGYQICGYFAPTSRLGDPSDFKAFVDQMHEAGIGVILDWVPAYFPKDEHGLADFDGAPLYECPEPDMKEYPLWGTRRFDVRRNEVRSFLISNAIYWLCEYHADGLRVDAVSAMLYGDESRYEKRLADVEDFLRELCSAVKENCPRALMIAEEASFWQKVTDDAEDGGLGFDLKWNTGWTQDTLAYAAEDPLFRKHHHEKVTFSMTYAFGENYILPVSHEENTDGKKAFLDKMPGDYWQKFASARAFSAYMMTHPGKKLTFMGSEIGQISEWNHNSSVDWFLLDYEAHAKHQLYISELNHFYLENPPLWQIDTSWDGFKWIDPNNRNHSIISYIRTDKKGHELIVVINFTPVAREDYLLGVPASGEYEEVFNSDDERFGGSGVLNSSVMSTTGKPWNYLPESVCMRIPPLGVSILKRRKNK